MKAHDPQTTNMSVAEILKWIEGHQSNSELTTICPANFFTSVKNWFTICGPDIWSLAKERDDLHQSLLTQRVKINELLHPYNLIIVEFPNGHYSIASEIQNEN